MSNAPDGLLRRPTATVGPLMSSPTAAPKYLSTVPPQEIVPVLNSRFESSVPGIFVVGDVTGTPLVKVAANQGRAVIAGLAGRRGNTPADGPLDVVIVGGGPAGLSAALEAKRLGLRYVLLERDRLASTVRAFPPGKVVYAEPRGVENRSELDLMADLGREEFLARVDGLVADHQLHVREGTEVKRVRPAGEHLFHVETATGQVFPARNVVLAVGRQGQPRVLGVPGEELAHKVSHRLHHPDDYRDQDILVVGGGNAAIEAALLLAGTNRVTLAYRGTDLFRAKADNREQIEAAVREGRVQVRYQCEVRRIGEREVELALAGRSEVVPNDRVVVLIGTLPPVPFLMDAGLELDGVWTLKRFAWALVGLLLGLLIYFGAKHIVLRPEDAGSGRLLIPGVGSAAPWIGTIAGWAFGIALPVAWLVNLAMLLVSYSRRLAGRNPLIPQSRSVRWLVAGVVAYSAYHVAAHVLTTDPQAAGDGPYYVPGLDWAFRVIPTYFSNLSGVYYLLYFSAIVGFGVYWAVRSGSRLVWKRNLTIIAVQWTLWWGIPTALAILLGRNPWTPLLARSLNAWPLNMAAFRLDPVVGPGDPAWWHTVAVFGVVWAVFLTFVVIPLVTVRWGKLYCSYVCSCGALAETVGNGFRHRGPKGDAPRKWERAGFVFVLLAGVATAADLCGFEGPLGLYNVWVGTLLAGAVAIGLYPFLGQRVWCRMWCPLAFWMNFWGRWSRFKITAEKGKCIDCNVCNQYCQMGIDIKSRALRGQDVTLADTPCVGCGECVVRCPMQILHVGDQPKPLIQLGTDRLPKR